MSKWIFWHKVKENNKIICKFYVPIIIIILTIIGIIIHYKMIKMINLI